MVRIFKTSQKYEKYNRNYYKIKNLVIDKK